eukprot:PhM_4_TR5158/c1_g1_i1/m.61865
MPLLEPLDAELRSLMPSWTLLAWLDGEAALPFDVQSSALVAWPMTTVFQLVSFYLCWKVLLAAEGPQRPFEAVSYERFREALSTGGLLTHGKGILAALAVALSNTAEDFIRNSVRVIRMSFQAGAVHEGNNEVLLRSGTAYKTYTHQRYLIHVVNIPLHSLQILVDTVNDTSALAPGIRAFSDIVISRILSPKAAVVCGHPLDLCRLERAIMEFSDETGVKILKSILCLEGPELSEYYCRTLSRTLLNAWIDDGIALTCTDLRLEVFSPVNGHPLAESPNLLEDLSRICTYQSHNLINSLCHVQGHDNVIDIGPGALAARVGYFLRWMDSDSSVICVPQGTVLPQQAPSPKRSTKREARASTFEKCAILNDIISQTTWDGKPEEVGTQKFVDLHTTFLELGLVRGFDSAMESISPRISPKQSVLEASVYQGFNLQQHESLVFTKDDIVRIGHVDNAFEMLQYVQRAMLTTYAVAFVHELNSRVSEKAAPGDTSIEFPLHTLLLCRDVSALVEYWDTLEFISRRFSSTQTERSAVESDAAKRKMKLIDTVRSLFAENGGVTMSSHSFAGPNRSLTEIML